MKSLFIKPWPIRDGILLWRQNLLPSNIHVHGPWSLFLLEKSRPHPCGFTKQSHSVPLIPGRKHVNSLPKGTINNIGSISLRFLPRWLSEPPSRLLLSLLHLRAGKFIIRTLTPLSSTVKWLPKYTWSNLLVLFKWEPNTLFACYTIFSIVCDKHLRPHMSTHYTSIWDSLVGFTSLSTITYIIFKKVCL